jgi:hypothetical protein
MGFMGFQSGTNYLFEKKFFLTLLALFIAIAYLLLLKKLFLEPLEKHRAWVEVHGIFSKKSGSKKISSERNGIDIIKGGEKSYSVADELLKWSQLKEAGHISEKEFKDAKNKLLNHS